MINIFNEDNAKTEPTAVNSIPPKSALYLHYCIDDQIMYLLLIVFSANYIDQSNRDFLRQWRYCKLITYGGVFF